MILEILTFPNPVLRQKCTPVETFDKELQTLSENLLDTMYDAPGVGLAANQVGVLKRILVIDIDFDIEGDDDESRKIINKKPHIYINPVLISKSGSTVFKEGCLSVPGFNEQVSRFEKVTVKYQDMKGAFHEENLDGLLAIALQHEMDHLDGKLFIDRLSELKKSMIKTKLLKSRPEKFERDRFKVEL